MSEEAVRQSKAQWAIDLNWLNKTGRSFSILARDTLCAKCRKKLNADTGEVRSADLLRAVHNCCAKSPDFITVNAPLYESIFRVFLANGNKPLTLGEISEQLNRRCGIDTYRTSPAVLSRLINSDQYYGIRSKSI